MVKTFNQRVEVGSHLIVPLAVVEHLHMQQSRPCPAVLLIGRGVFRDARPIASLAGIQHAGYDGADLLCQFTCERRGCDHRRLNQRDARHHIVDQAVLEHFADLEPDVVELSIGLTTAALKGDETTEQILAARVPPTPPTHAGVDCRWHGPLLLQRPQSSHRRR